MVRRRTTTIQQWTALTNVARGHPNDRRLSLLGVIPVLGE
jgi:hypothetical protein